MAIFHIVLFAFKDTTTQEQVVENCKNMLALREKCLHPTSNEPYIKSFVGGEDNSPEGAADPYTHGFVVEFENESDRDYYVHKDPAHLSFVKSVGSHLSSVKAVDFKPGVF